MILQHVMEMPRLFSGQDDKGRPWTCLYLPAAFGARLAQMPQRQRASIMKGLNADLKRSMR